MGLPSSSMARPISFPSFPAHHNAARRFGQILTERWLCLCNFWTVFWCGYKVAQNLATFQAKSFSSHSGWQVAQRPVLGQGLIQVLLDWLKTPL